MNKSHLLFLFIFVPFSLFAQSNKKVKPFTQAEIDLIYQADSSKEMRVWKINAMKDSIFLRQKSSPVQVNPNDTALIHFTQRLLATVLHPDSRGVGIAAPQVGIGRQIIWVKRYDKDGEPFEVFLNPKIIKYSDSTKLTREGCLSIPNRREYVKRPCVIDIEYDKLDGTHHKETVGEFTAVIFQHEVDHLNGILYLDHLLEEMKIQEIKDNFSEKKKKLKRQKN